MIYKRLLVITLTVSSVVSLPQSHARGGFGGGSHGSFAGGGIRSDGLERDDAGEGSFDHYGGSAYARDFDSAFSRDDFDRSDFAGDRPMDNLRDAASRLPAFQDSRPEDNGVRNWLDSVSPTARSDISTDGGFGRILGSSGLAHTGNATNRILPSDMANIGNAYRQGFNHYNYFNHNWWQQHPWSWYNRYWGDCWPWTWTAWPALGAWWGVDTDDEPVYYDYGDNITYQDDNVYYGSQPVCSATTYYEQAENLAASAPIENTQPNSPQKQSEYAKDWKPLGIFALMQNNQSDTSQMLQLCVNKSGIIRGNYYNALTDETKPIHGAVDRKNMRASWTIGTNSKVVYDTGVGNLLKSQSPILVHYSKDSTQQWILVRLQNPNAGGQS